MTIKNNITWEPYQFNFQEDEEVEQYDDTYDEDKVGLDLPSVMTTPFGVFRVDDQMNPFKRFQFWMGHTNFDITPQIKDTLNRTPGVEVLHILTRYRFILGAGQAFDFGQVRVEIERELCGKHKIEAFIEQINDDSVQKKVRKLKDSLDSSDYWLLYLFPNGEISSGKLESKDDFDKLHQVYQHAQQLSHGVLITSEDDDKREA